MKNEKPQNLFSKDHCVEKHIVLIFTDPYSVVHFR